mgnify:CR=1 FL=1
MKKIGKVIEVFIPETNDVMNSTKIGFKIKIDDEIIEIIEEQNKDNCDIYKDDLVKVIKENNNIKIELYKGDVNE